MRGIFESLEARRLLSSGALDHFFGDGGTKVLPATFDADAVAMGSSGPEGFLLDSRGRAIVLAALYSDQIGDEAGDVLYRVLPDGQLDPTFGHDPSQPGVAATDIPNAFADSSVNFGGAFALMPDGDILIGDARTTERLRPDGSIDPTFADHGKLTISDMDISSATVAPDGRILLVGNSLAESIATDIVVERFNSNGTPDTTFGQNGIDVVHAARGAAAKGYAAWADGGGATVLADGNILISGSNGFTSNGGLDENGEPSTDESDFSIFVRLRPDGSVDTAYGFEGVALLNQGESSAGEAVDPAGAVTFALTGGNDPDVNTLVGRLDANGKVDSSFANVVVPGAEQLDLSGLLQQTNDKTIVFGGASDTIGRSIAPTLIARLNLDGTLDTSFGSAGSEHLDTSDLGGFTDLVSGSVEPDGSILVLGLANGKMQLARYFSGDAPGSALTFKHGRRSPAAGSNVFEFTITYRDPDGIDLSTLDDRDVRVDGPGGSTRRARLVNVNKTPDGQVHARYKFSAPSGVWTSADNGAYRIRVRSGQVSDSLGHFMSQVTAGVFHVNIAASAGASIALPPKRRHDEDAAP